MRYSIALAAAALILAQAAHADLTIHYKTSIEMAPGLPAPMAEAMQKQMGSSIPADSMVRVHGDVVASQSGPLSFFLDYAKKQLTVVHPASQRYSTIPTTEFPKQIELLLPEQARQTMQGLKVDIQTTKSGKTALILNVPAQEVIITMSIETPNPAGPPVQVKMEMHDWVATSEAMERFPEFKQWNAKKWAETSGLEPTQIMMTAFGQGPTTEKFRAAIQELTKETTGFVLRMEMRMFVPFLAQMMQSQGVTLGDRPLISANLEMDRFQTDPIPASAFEVPAGYQSAPFIDVMKELIPRPTLPPGAPQAQTQAEPAVERPPLSGPILRVGGGVTAPKLIQKVEPTYTPDARADLVQGTVLLYVVVAEDGYVRNVRVLRPLHPGLDLKAIECVKQWQFQPGMKDQQPVNVEAQIEINFRLGPPH